jgi:hypothetical protein
MRYSPASRSRSIPLLLLSLALLSSACALSSTEGDDASGSLSGGGSPAPPDDDGAGGPTDAALVAPDDLLGDWNITEGRLVWGQSGLFQEKALRLAADDTGVAINTSIDNPDITICWPVRQLRGEDYLVLDYSPIGSPHSRAFTIAELDGDELTMFDQGGLLSEGGKITVLSRPTAADPIPLCQSVDELRFFTGLPTAPGGELEFDGATLYYQASPSDPLVAVSAATGSLTTAPPIGGPMLAWQGGFFWATTNATTVALISPVGEVDSIDTAALGQPIAPAAMAVDPATGIVWIGGDEQATGRTLLLEVDARAEPPVLLDVAEAPGGVDLRTLAFDGSNLWTVAVSALIGSTLVRMDPATVEIVDVWQVPLHGGVSWTAVAILGTRMFVHGQRIGLAVLDDNGAIIEDDRVIAEINLPD